MKLENCWMPWMSGNTCAMAHWVGCKVVEIRRFNASLPDGLGEVLVSEECFKQIEREIIASLPCL